MKICVVIFFFGSVHLTSSQLLNSTDTSSKLKVDFILKFKLSSDSIVIAWTVPVTKGIYFILKGSLQERGVSVLRCNVIAHADIEVRADRAVWVTWLMLFMLVTLMQKMKILQIFSVYAKGYFKNYWTNNRPVCTHLNVFVILNPNINSGA